MTDQRRNAVLEQQKAIRDEYRQQAPRWGKAEISEHLRWVVDQLPLSPQSEVVDVAAGTGLFGRAVAPAVARVTAVDITPEMIAEGRRRAEEDGIPNMVWHQGEAESLPFPDGSFDLAITRYSIHHFVDPSAVLREMGRTCRPDGTIVAVDMVSDEDPAVASRQDALETVMDPTHTSVLSPSRLVQAATGGGLTVQGYLSRDVPMSFDLWQAHVPADSEARATVRRALEEELAGGDQTGMRPFIRDGALWFMHVWGLLLAGKSHRGRH
jgi:ubiquinone/menaquinone biosynthesis C-methylase UbiE